MKKLVILVLAAAVVLLGIIIAPLTHCANIPLAIYEEWDTLFRFEQDGLWGFKDEYGNVVIEPKFNGASHFSEGLASIRGVPGDYNARGFIDTMGELAIYQPEVITVVNGFREGFSIIIERSWDFRSGDVGNTDHGPFIFIDRNGENIFGQEFANASSFRDGLHLYARLVEILCLSIGVVKMPLVWNSALHEPLWMDMHELSCLMEL